MTPGQQAAQRELSLARAQARGRRLQAVVTLACASRKCPVNRVSLEFSETDESLPMQFPLVCGRCRAPLERYIGLSLRPGEDD
jgi:hypothetical protein